jgi:exodeoxyribonuclease VII small subunit
MTTSETRAQATDPAPIATFEDALARLGEIVELLENGSLPLEESLRLFEEGVRLARTSQARLEAAEKRVEELLTIDDAGNPVVRELELLDVRG